MRAYFRAYRARITDLEEELAFLSDALDDSEMAHAKLSQRLRNIESDFDSRLRDEEHERWRLGDSIKKLEQDIRRLNR